MVAVRIASRPADTPGRAKELGWLHEHGSTLLPPDRQCASEQMPGHLAEPLGQRHELLCRARGSAEDVGDGLELAEDHRGVGLLALGLLLHAFDFSVEISNYLGFYLFSVETLP